MPIRRRPDLRMEAHRDKMRARLARERDKGNKDVQLMCAEGHYWFSKIDPKSVARAGLKQPTCKSCQGLFATWATPGTYTHDENAVCDHKCREANPFTDCICCCGRKNHGIDHVSVR
jgi:hypothetical protein